MNSINKNNILITILGPTASGKTGVAAALAAKLNGEIISADSRQIYKNMNLGTGKDYDDYIVHNQRIPYHLIDIKDPGYKYNLFEYQKDFLMVYKKILLRDNVPVLCGGSGLYIEGVTKGYKMLAVPPDMKLRKELEDKSIEDLATILKEYRKLHNTTDVDTKKRAIRAIEIEKYQKENLVKIQWPEINPIYFGIRYDRQSQRKRITQRLKQRLDNGMLDEVRNILDTGISSDDLIYYGLEYKYLTLHIIGQISYDEMFEKLNIAIHQFAKRQMTWFRRMERNGDKINWFDAYEPIENKINRMLILIDKSCK